MARKMRRLLLANNRQAADTASSPAPPPFRESLYTHHELIVVGTQCPMPWVPEASQRQAGGEESVANENPRLGQNSQLSQGSLPEVGKK